MSEQADTTTTTTSPAPAAVPAIAAPATAGAGGALSRVCIIRAPGGLPGIEIHAGAWLAMEEAGIRPACVTGASAGAIVSAIQAYAGVPGAFVQDAEDFVALVKSLRTEDLIQKRLGWKARIFWLTHFCNPEPIEKLLAQLLPEHFGELSMRLLVSATAMHSDPANCAYFSHGPCLREAVRASSSIAGVWPYETIAGFDYTDGGTSDPFPQPWDLALYDDVFVINPIRTCNFGERDKNMISRLLWNVEQLQDSQAEDAQRDLLDRCHDKLHWLDIDMGEVSCLEFSEGHKLVDMAYSQTSIWLAGLKAAKKV